MDNWEKQLRDRLSSAKVPADPSEWDLFQQKLEASRSGSSAGRTFPWYWIAIPAVAVAAALVLLLPRQGVQPTPPGPEPEIVAVSSNNDAAQTPAQEDRAAEKLAVLPRTDIKKVTSHQALAENHVATDEIRQEEENIQPEHPDAGEPVIPTSQKDTLVQEEEPVVPVPLPQRIAAAPDPDLSGRIRSSLRTGIVTGSAVALAGTLAGVFLPSISFGARSAAFDPLEMAYLLPGPGWGSNGEGGGYIPPVVHHMMPVDLGLSLRVPIAGRLSLTTGVEYSQCHSTKTQYHITRDQYAHYLGVPLRMDWSFLQQEHWDLYAGAGIKTDWCPAATFDGQPIRRNPFVFSAQLAGGVEYRITRLVGVYIEPRLSWFPQTREAPFETYRTLLPVTFNMAAGLRFTLP